MDTHHASHSAPGVFWALPFCFLLLTIAVAPLLHSIKHWWHKHSNKMLVALVLSAITLLYYALRGEGYHGSEKGMAAVGAVLHHSVIGDYFPFMVLLFSLYTISGGILIRGSFKPTPATNASLLLIGALLASFIGTTGASMLLIRPLLEINKHRRNVKHSVIFFIFLVSNIGGSLLPVGDPPLFLGYLKGVPFLWTLQLWVEWITCAALLLVVYLVMDIYHYKREDPERLKQGDGDQIPFTISGGFNLALLIGVVIAVALLVPGKTLVGTNWVVPNIFLREWIQLALAGISLALTRKEFREANAFDFGAIIEVGCLFIGIFITMQVPVEILQIKGPSMGLTSPAHYFWATGVLSSFLDNAPTYVVFFETAGSLQATSGDLLHGVATASGTISNELLKAISCGAVFMGANTYIGNGPNFMVKSIAEMHHIHMPSFFGYMLYSGAILIPCFAIVTLLFFV